MGRIRIEREIDASPEEVWRALRDFGGIHRWNPNLRGSRVLEGSPLHGVGAARQCDLADGKRFLRERITDWQEGSAYTVEIYEGPLPLDHVSATLAVAPRGPRAVASMDMRYEPRGGWLGRALDALLLRRSLRGTMAKVLAGLEAHVVGEAARHARGGEPRPASLRT